MAAGSLQALLPVQELDIGEQVNPAKLWIRRMALEIELTGQNAPRHSRRQQKGSTSHQTSPCSRWDEYVTTVQESCLVQRVDGTTALLMLPERQDPIYRAQSAARRLLHFSKQMKYLPAI